MPLDWDGFDILDENTVRQFSAVYSKSRHCTQLNLSQVTCSCIFNDNLAVDDSMNWHLR